MGPTNLFLAATHDPKTRLTSQGEHAHIRPSPKSSPTDVGYYNLIVKVCYKESLFYIITISIYENLKYMVIRENFWTFELIIML